MQIVNRVRGLMEWYRALRSLNKILATMSVVVLMAAGCSDSNAPDNHSTLKVVNTADHSVWYVFVRDCGTTDWGDDLLGADVVNIGETQSFRVGTGCKDVLLETEPMHAGVAQWDDQSFTADTTVSVALNAWQYEE